MRVSRNFTPAREDCLIWRSYWSRNSPRERGNFFHSIERENRFPSDPFLRPSHLAIHLFPEHWGQRPLGNEFFFHPTKSSFSLGFAWRCSMWRVSRPMRATRRSNRSCIICRCCRFIDTRTNVIRFHTAGWTNVNYCWHFRRRPRRFRRPSTDTFTHCVSYFHALEISRTRAGIRRESGSLRPINNVAVTFRFDRSRCFNRSRAFYL